MPTADATMTASQIATSAAAAGPERPQHERRRHARQRVDRPTERSMPPEMITMVAPTAMTAKKLASVAV